MCVAILIKPNTAIDIEKVRRGAVSNPDGSGYAFVRNGKVEIRRSMKWEELEKQFLRDMQNNSESVFLVHHRIKSHGEVCKENCHPFRMADGGALIHNGVIPIHGMPKEWSDTRHFTKNVIDKLPRDWSDGLTWQSMVTQMISTSSKMCFLWPDGSYLILNEGRGFWEDDQGDQIHQSAREQEDGRVWYSNQSCKVPYKSPTSGTNHRAPTGTGTGNSGSASTPAASDRPAAPNPNAVVPVCRVDSPPPAAEGSTMYSVTPLPEDQWEQVSKNRWRPKTELEKAAYREAREKSGAGKAVTPTLVTPKSHAADDFHGLLIECGVCPYCERVFRNEGATRAHVRSCDAKMIVDESIEKATRDMVAAGVVQDDEWTEDMFLGYAGL